MRSRNKALDLLKVIGLFAIMLSHSIGLPYTINYFRNFEVILLVLVSGMLFKDYKKESISFEYIKKRLCRIVIPTWAFLAIFLLLLYISSKVLHTTFPYSIRDIIESFTMTNGIGYVWIMLVYCFIALGLPIIWSIYNKAIKSNYSNVFFVGMIITYIIYEVARFALTKASMDTVFLYIIKNTVMYFVIYSFIAWLGSCLGQKKATISLLSGMGLTIVHFILSRIITSYTKNPIMLNTFKYPPSFVYILYGMGVSLVLIGIIRLLFEESITQWKPLAFVARESQWIYFNHIYMIFIWNQFIGTDNWFLSFLFFAFGAVLVTWFQVVLITLLFGSRCDKFSRFMVRTFS